MSQRSAAVAEANGQLTLTEKSLPGLREAVRLAVAAFPGACVVDDPRAHGRRCPHCRSRNTRIITDQVYCESCGQWSEKGS